jgi:hypothetical protein
MLRSCSALSLQRPDPQSSFPQKSHETADCENVKIANLEEELDSANRLGATATI